MSDHTDCSVDDVKNKIDRVRDGVTVREVISPRLRFELKVRRYLNLFLSSIQEEEDHRFENMRLNYQLIGSIELKPFTVYSSHFPRRSHPSPTLFTPQTQPSADLIRFHSTRPHIFIATDSTIYPYGTPTNQPSKALFSAFSWTISDGSSSKVSDCWAIIGGMSSGREEILRIVLGQYRFDPVDSIQYPLIRDLNSSHDPPSFDYHSSSSINSQTHQPSACHLPSSQVNFDFFPKPITMFFKKLIITKHTHLLPVTHITPPPPLSLTHTLTQKEQTAPSTIFT